MVPRPTRPRSWCNWDNPYLSAFSISIITAFGTSTPTSTTVVETRTSISPFANAVMTVSFSFGFILPCRIPITLSGNVSVCKAFAYCTTLAISLVLSSTKGQIIYACCPASRWVRIYCKARARFRLLIAYVSMV